MAIKKRDAEVIEEVSKVTSSQRFKIKDLLKKSEALGYSKYLAAGAFFGASLDIEITKSAFISTIEEYKKKRVV